jgi:hypothetical protein
MFPPHLYSPRAGGGKRHDVDAPLQSKAKEADGSQTLAILRPAIPGAPDSAIAAEFK